MVNKRTLFLLFILFLHTGTLLLAKADEDSLKVRKVYEIEGIRVVGESPAKKIGNIDIKEIDRDRVATDAAVGNIIRDMPGVYLTERGKGESVVRFRGFEDRHIRVLIDGIPVSAGYFGNYDLHLISADNISRIHLIKGPVSHQYGLNMMGGVLNIVTDNLREENILNAKVLYSSHGKVQTSLKGSYALGRTQLYLSGAYLNQPGFLLPGKETPLGEKRVEQEGDRRINSDREQYTARMRLLTDIAGIHTLSFASGYSYMPHKGNPPSIYAHDDNRYSQIEDWKMLSTSFSAASSFSDDLKTTTSLYYDRTEDTYLSFNNARLDRVIWSSLIRNKTLGVHLNANLISGEYFSNDLGFRTEIKSYERTGGPGYENKWVDNRQSMTKFNHSLHFPEKGERYSLTIGNALSSYNHSGTDSYQWYWEPQAGLIYHYNRHILSLSYGLANQFPTMRELFSSTSGNPELDPERAYKAEAVIGTSADIVDFKGEVVLYYNRINELIRRDRTAYYNVARMSSYGAEINLRFSLLARLEHRYGVSHIRLDEENSSVRLMEYPEIKLKFEHKYDISENLFISHRMEWIDESLTYYRDDEFYILPSYLTQELGLKYFLTRGAITLNVTNLFDAYYEPQYGYPAPGREFTLAFEIPFKL